VYVGILFVDSFCQGSQLSLQVGTHETFGRPVPKYVFPGPAVLTFFLTGSADVICNLPSAANR